MPEIHDRGMVKWQPFDSLLSSKKVAREIIKEKNKVAMPTLSEDQLLNIEEKYTKEDLIKIFEDRVNRQNQNKEHEQFIECAYEMIVKYYPELKDKLDILNKRSTNE